VAASRTWTKTCAVVGAVAIAAVAALAGAAPAIAATSWTLASSPNPGSSQNFLDAVACADAIHCWAVGATTNVGASTQALIESWNGSTWTVDTVPDENNGSTLQDNRLAAITCTSATDCWAVGSFFNSAVSHDEPLWEYWDGSTWTASTFPVGVSSDYFLYGVSCVDDNNCWAVGRKITGPTTTVWFQQWNGSFWSTNPSTDAGEMDGVSCVDTTHCWAVGATVSSPDHTLVETWNGTAWTLTSSPNTASGDNDGLRGVSCVSTTWCWAVGTANDGTRDQNLFEHWDGSAWTIPADTTASDNNSPSAHNNFMDGVTCQSTTFCWSVGFAGSGPSGLDRTLIDAWDGTSWTFLPDTPNGGTPSQFDVLDGVACAGTTFCAAVGEYSIPDPTLIVQYQVAATPTPTGVPVPATGGASAAAAGAPLGLPLVVGGAALLLVMSAVGMAGRRRVRGG
jgi:hypothetical protein